MTIRTKAGLMVIAAAAAMALGPVGVALGGAVTNTYTGASGDPTNYNVAGNWSQNYVPGSNINNTDTAFINNGAAVTLTDNLSANQANLTSVSVGAGSLTVSTSTGKLFTKTSMGVNGAGTAVNVTNSGLLHVGQTLTVTSGSTVKVDQGATLEIADTVNTLNGTAMIGGGALGDTKLYVSDGTFQINSPAAASAPYMRVYGDTGGDGYIKLSGTGNIDTGINGTFILGGTVNSSRSGVQDPTIRKGIIDQTGGTISNLRAFAISNGAYNLSDGTLEMGSKRDSVLQVGVKASGSFNMTGGQANVARAFVGTSSGGDGLLAISGGTFNMPSTTAGSVSVTMTIGNGTIDSAGVLRVTGHAATITVNSPGGYRPLQMYANGTLNFQIGPGGVSPIIINTATTDSRNGTILAGTLDLDAINGYVPKLGDYFDLIVNNNNYTGTSGGTFTNGFDITQLDLAAADDGKWSFGVIQDNGLNILRVTSLVPEPSTLSLVAVGGLALLRRRRRVM